MITTTIAYIAKAQWKNSEYQIHEARVETKEQALEEIRYFKMITSEGEGWKYSLYRVEERIVKESI